MFHNKRMAGHHGTTLDRINSHRMSDGLAPCEAPSEKSQIVAAVVLILLTAVLMFLMP